VWFCYEVPAGRDWRQSQGETAGSSATTATTTVTRISGPVIRSYTAGRTGLHGRGQDVEIATARSKIRARPGFDKGVIAGVRNYPVGNRLQSETYPVSITPSNSQNA